MTYVKQVADRIRARLDPEVVPDDADDLLLMYAVLALAKGRQVTRADIHDAWSAWMTMRGEAGHEAVRPLDELPEDVRAEDDPFVQAIREVANELPDS